MNEKFEDIKHKFDSINCEKAEFLIMNTDRCDGSQRDPLTLHFIVHKNKFIKKFRNLNTLIANLTELRENNEPMAMTNTLAYIREEKTELQKQDNLFGQLIGYLRYKLLKKEKVYIILEVQGEPIEMTHNIVNGMLCEYVTDAYPSGLETIDTLITKAERILHENDPTYTNSDTMNLPHTRTIESPINPPSELNTAHSSPPQVIFERTQPPVPIVVPTAKKPAPRNTSKTRAPARTTLKRPVYAEYIPPPAPIEINDLENFHISEPIDTVRHELFPPPQRAPPPPLQNNFNNSISIYEIEKFLPDFNGNITEFPYFWRKFKPYVGQNPTLSDVAKLFLLEAKCKGDAATLIQATSSHGQYGSYAEQRDALHSEFGDPHLIAQTLYQEMKTMKAVPNDPHHIRAAERALKAKTNMIWQLQAQQVYPSEFRTWITRIFPSDFILSILRNVPIQSPVEEIITALEQKATQYRNGILHDGITDRQLQDNNFIMYAQTRGNTSCYLCEQSHHARNCTQYTSAADRRRRVRDAGLCYSCLSKDHNSSHCNENKPCPICRGKHHISICYDLYSLKSRSISRHNGPKSPHREVRYQHMDYSRDHRRSRYDRYDSHRNTSRSKERHQSRDSYKHNSRNRQQYRSQSRGSNHSSHRTPQNRERSNSYNGYRRNRDPTPFKQRQHHDRHDSSSRYQSRNRSDSRNRAPSYSKRTYLAESPKNTAVHNILTAPIITADGRDLSVNILIDNGSGQSYITDTLVSKLNLKKGKSQPLNIQLFSGVKWTVESTCHRIQLRHPHNSPIDILACSIPSIATSMGPHKLNREDLDMIYDKDLHVSTDPNKPIEIDILLGLDYLHILPDYDLPIVKLPSGLIASPTIYGYTIAGTYKPKKHDPHNNTPINTFMIRTEFTSPNLEDMWDMESQWMFRNPSAIEEDNQIMQNFRDTVQFTKTGIYVQLPWKTDGKHSLANNFQMANARLRALHRKHANTGSKVWDEYNKIIQDQLTSGIIERVHDIESTYPTYYIPHQAVYKESSATTKVRIVLDASSHVKGELSLNDFVHKGPTFLPQLCGILTRLRIGRYLLSADVEKAFHMIFLQHTERDATRFLWLKDYNGPLHEQNIEILRFARVPFGINASPFLLAAAIQTGFERFATSQVKDSVLANLYVDNVFLTSDKADELTKISETTQGIFKQMNMHLREFLSNSQHVMNSVHAADKAKTQQCKILGIQWTTITDSLTIEVSLPTPHKQCLTKRIITRAAHSTFDPIGLTTPLLTKARIFLQHLWELKLEWDEPLNNALTAEWEDIQEQHSNFTLTLPRMILQRDFTGITNLCIFTDASSTCFAACAYLRFSTGESYENHLLMSRHRLLPLPTKSRKITIPKAELTSLELGIKLAQFIHSELPVNVSHVYVFNDSEIALSWLASPQKNLGLYVNNRIQSIKKTLEHFTEHTIPFSIHHVPSEHNPADHATRGLSKDILQKSNWLRGPSFLKNNSFLEKFREFKLPANTEVQVLLSLEQYSHDRSTSPYEKPTNSFKVFIKRTYTVLKAVATFKKLIDKNKHPINLRKLQDRARILCIHTAQQNINLKSTPFNKLPVTTDSEGILVCISRIAQQPKAILLDPKHWCTKAIIYDIHTDNGHAMTHQSFTDLRRSYWLPAGRQLIRNTLRNCFSCRIRDKRPYKYPLMPSLPKQRVTLSRPFENIGIDLAGPFHTEYNTKSYKVWVVLITCMSTRAVHLEVADDLTAVTLLLALKRFIARRGIPATIMSDNGTNFVGGKNILEQQYTSSDIINEYCSAYNISWKFITPLSPWKGGFYERLMSIMKRCLKHSIYKVTNRVLFDTIVVQAEAIMNSRPLTHTNTEFHEPHPLCPVDFLIPEAELLLPGEDTMEISSGNATKRQTLERYHETKRYLRTLRERWETEYLQELRDRHQARMNQGKYSATPPQIGDVVHLILCEKKHKLGIITNLIGISNYGRIPV